MDKKEKTLEEIISTFEKKAVSIDMLGPGDESTLKMFESLIDSFVSVLMGGDVSFVLLVRDGKYDKSVTKIHTRLDAEVTIPDLLIMQDVFQEFIRDKLEDFSCKCALCGENKALLQKRIDKWASDGKCDEQTIGQCDELYKLYKKEKPKNESGN